MSRNSIETNLTSSESGDHYSQEVSLQITAYFESDGRTNDNTLTFQCDPVGTNYRSSFLEVTLDSWSKVVEIREFLAECFGDDITTRQTLSVEVEDGIASVTPFDGVSNEEDELESITIEVSGDRIEFFRSGSVYPYIFTYEQVSEDGSQDRNNVEKLLKFFEKAVSLHPNFDPRGGFPGERAVSSLFDRSKTQELLTRAFSSDSEVLESYQRAVREFENGEHDHSIRDVGKAAEVLIEKTTSEVYRQDDVPDNIQGRLSKLDKTEDGLPSFVGKAISPLWWLRNEASHHDSYQLSEKDAAYALLCFQMAAEKLISEHLND